MKFELLNAALYTWPYNDKNVDIICTQLKGTVYEKRISIVPKLDKYFQKPEEKGGRNQVKKEQKEEFTYIITFFAPFYTLPH